ncbi:MAG: asparagine synthase (glutamine-hydrolyzing) [Candidatus Omnitrophota bacterium]
MCGICGALGYTQNKIDAGLIKQMCAAIEHRGPDDEGIYLDQQVDLSLGLGHKRLKIIDLSAAGHQPMCNEDESIWVVFNGEIYNYPELRIELENKGHRFRSHTDTEAITHLYEEYGRACVKFMRGMFAFALWDKKNQILLLARDRVGKKPLLYSYGNGVFCFASEFLSLLESGYVNKEIDYAAIDYYLSFGYIPAPLTIYKNVFKLLPAHTLVLKDKNIHLEEYWKLDYSKKIRISEDDAAKELLRHLREAVKVRLYSDVPLGAFLSGGIDSSTVVGLMSELMPERVKTFSIGFEERDYSELKYAKNIADKFDTEHHEFMVKPKAIEILPLMVERYGEPYSDSSCIPTYYVSRETRRHVTVALNGDGGDELFAGYERYQAMFLSQKYQRLPQLPRKIINSFIHLLPNYLGPGSKIKSMKNFIYAASLPMAERYLRWAGIVDTVTKKNIYSDNFASLVSGADPLKFIEPYLNDSQPWALIDSMLQVDMLNYLPYDLLVKVDIASMANSLEVRSPFLDTKFMEFAASLPAEYKMKHLVKKYILKKAIKDLVPEKNVYRRKMGFSVPIGEWLKGDLKGLLSDALLSKKFTARGYFKQPVIEEMLKQHLSGKRDHAFKLWSILMLELWHNRFID